MKRIVILVSGRGSNLEALLRACTEEAWPAAVVAVISNRPGVGALDMAARHGIPSRVVDHRAYPDRSAFDAALADAVDAFAPDWLVLAGFMRILTEGFVARYAGRMLNIHPSLLPAFPGLHTHRRAIEAGCKWAGATVHLVTATLDHGPVIAQAAVPVLAGDDEDRLAARVLAAEHRLYPMALRWCVTDRLHVEGGQVVQHDGEPQAILGAEPPG